MLTEQTENENVGCKPVQGAGSNTTAHEAVVQAGVERAGWSPGVGEERKASAREGTDVEFINLHPDTSEKT